MAKDNHLSRIVTAAHNLDWLGPDEFEQAKSLVASKETDAELETLLIDQGFLTPAQFSSLQRTLDVPEQETNRYGRFLVTESHAQGGLGEVFKAEDRELHRQVALKQLKGRFASNQDLKQRFMMEAELTGNLEHPGIVPVYGLGIGDDGIPYYAMRFIHGKSMKQAADDFHSREDSGSSERRIEFRKLLNSFGSVCQTMHFAHSRGVLHRDIKPDNIMLGEFGETMVVDWGIAKIIGRKSPELLADSEELKTASAAGSSTRDGVVIGTPGFMSPEQTLGWHDSLSPASDVYSLGMTLYYLLTGKLPYDADSTIDDIFQKTCSSQFASPIELNRRIPKPLNAICSKAIANKGSDRYASAKQLADEIEAYLADEPVKAWREPFFARMGRIGRRYRSAVAVGAMAMLLTTGLAVGASLLINQQRNIAESERGKAQDLAVEKQQLAEMEREARIDADQQRDTAEQERIAANEARAEAEQTLDFLVEAFRSPDPTRDGYKVTVAEVLKRAAEEMQTSLASQPRQQIPLMISIAETYLGLGLEEPALPVALKAREMSLKEYGADHLMTSDTHSILGLVYTEFDRYDEALAEHERCYEIRSQEQGEDHLDVLITQNNIANALFLSGREDRSVELYENSFQTLKDRYGERNFNTQVVMGNLVILYGDQGKYEKALEIGNRVLEIRNEVHGENSAPSLMAMSNLQDLYLEMGQLDEVERLAEQVYEGSRETLGTEHSDTIGYALELARAKSSLGDTERAIEIIREMEDGILSRYGDQHSIYFASKDFLAVAYARSGDFQTAHGIFESILQPCRDALGDQHSTTQTVLDNSAVTLERIGKIRQSAELLEQIIEIKRTNSDSISPQLLVTMNNLGHQQMNLGETAKAIATLSACIDGWEELESIGRVTAISYEGWCHALMMERDFDEVLEIVESAIEVVENFEEADPAGAARLETIQAYALAQTGRLKEAEETLNRVIDFFESRNFKPSMLAYRMCILASIRSRQGEHEKAGELLEKNIDILADEIHRNPAYYWYQYRFSLEHLAAVYKELGEDELVAATEKKLQRELARQKAVGE